VIPRSDALPKVTGKAVFADDLSFEGMLYALVRRAEVPSAIVRSIRTEKALELPGVRAVLTAADIPGERNHGLVISDWPVMVGEGERIRYVGDAVAIVAAETREIAREAIRQIGVEFELLPVVSDPIQARSEDSPVIHPGGNLLKHIAVHKGNLDTGFESAEVVIEHTFRTPTYDHVFMEPECSVARLTSDGRIEIYVGSQIPYADRQQVARALGWSEDRVRVIGTVVGGGFGGKEDIAGQIHAALLARATGRPVKLLFDRRESLLVHPKRHATRIRVKLGARRDGTLTAVKTELYGDTGAYASLGEHVLTRATTHSSGPYEVPAVRSDCYAMYTNNPPAGAFRGFGVLQAAFAIESAMDMLSHELGLDPIYLRRRNALQVGSQTSTGQVLKESVGLLECITKVETELRRLAGGDPFKAREVEEKPHLKRAWGFATAYKNAGLGGGAADQAGAEVELYADGSFEVRGASAELGQGLPTVLQLVAAEVLDQSPERVRVYLSDTDRTPDGGPTTASRQTYVAGNAVREASLALRQLLITELAERHDLPPERVKLLDGAAEVGSTTVPLAEVARDIIANGRSPRASFNYVAPPTQPLGEGGDMHFAYSFAAQAAEVEVDTHTGTVRVLRVLAANDVGTALNPLGVQGQVEGGIMMGIGHALTEVYIVEEGRVITDRLARYRMPSIMLTPEITSFIVEHPTRGGPFGAKGFGEIVSIPTVPAITNAIYNAVGVRVDELPCDPERILRAINLHEGY
jgi:xanthine dehydrogenase molybdenum-binding subunit